MFKVRKYNQENTAVTHMETQTTTFLKTKSGIIRRLMRIHRFIKEKQTCKNVNIWKNKPDKGKMRE